MESILLVDDEEAVLRGYQRSLRGQFKVDVAISGADALKKINESSPYPVVVSDMRMPEMSGVELLAKIKVRCPNTVRILLTGNSDQETAIRAINEGDVFRFLNKPCPSEALIATLSTAVQHHQLLIAEKDILENTLRGAVEVLVELLSLVRPEVLGQTMRISQLLHRLEAQLPMPMETWSLETAALLSQLGYTTLAPDLVTQIQAGGVPDKSAQKELGVAVELAATLVDKIPRLDEVADIIRYQDKHFDGGGHPKNSVSGTDIPLGARVLKCALDFDRYVVQGMSQDDALQTMERHAERYDPEVRLALVSFIEQEMDARDERIVDIMELTDRMILAEDVLTGGGLLLVPRGIASTASVRKHLVRFRDSGQIGKTLRVFYSS